MVDRSLFWEGDRGEHSSPLAARDRAFVRLKRVVLKTALMPSPLGEMVAVSDEQFLYLLDFVQRKGLDSRLARLQAVSQTSMVPGDFPPLVTVRKELESYFAGHLTRFKTPICGLGSDFQQKVWAGLQNIPYGCTQSYQEQAAAIGHPKAFRAVANANAANPLSIIVPCHRVIRQNGDLGGYGGGIERKKRLLSHEQTGGCL